MAREINSKIYDENVLNEGLQVQIDNYYEPTIASQKRRIEIIIEKLAPGAGEHILDLGCGVGTFAYQSALKGANVYGIDYSYESIKVANTLAKRFNTLDRSFFLTGNALKLPYKDNIFDKIVCADFIEHITDSEKEILLKEIRRVLKMDGIAVIFTPNGIREDLGLLYSKLKNVLFKEKVKVSDLHYGLISRHKFEKMLERSGFTFSHFYNDTTRPYLANIPICNQMLALNLLWIIRKS